MAKEFILQIKIMLPEHGDELPFQCLDAHKLDERLVGTVSYASDGNLVWTGDAGLFLWRLAKLPIYCNRKSLVDGDVVPEDK